MPNWIRIVLVLCLIMWIVSSAYYLVYSLFVRNDGLKDVQARHEMGINTGRESLAQLVVAMGTYKAFAFGIWLICGLYSAYTITPWGQNDVRGPFRILTVPVSIIIGQQLIGRSLLKFHNERRRVYEKDRREEITRLKQAENTMSTSMDNTTAALNNLADATRQVAETTHYQQRREDMEG